MGPYIISLASPYRGGINESKMLSPFPDRVLDLLWEFGVNHIDTAPKYGEAELRLGPWMKKYRDQFFLATKTNERTYQDAKDQFQRSLDRLQVDHVDLLQFHNLTDVVEREIIMGPGGALEFLVEAKEKGLTRFIGITGHGLDCPRFHRQTLEHGPDQLVLRHTGDHVRVQPLGFRAIAEIQDTVAVALYHVGLPAAAGCDSGDCQEKKEKSGALNQGRFPLFRVYELGLL